MMAELSTDLLEIVLKDVAAAGAEPWYPAAYAQATGVPRDRLDASLDRLRLAGLVQLTVWVLGRGQGYTLTPEGGHVLNNPRLLDRLREGRELPRRPEPRAASPESVSEPGSAWDRGEAIRQALLSPSQPVVTKALIWANIAVFAVGLWLANGDNAVNEYLGPTPKDQVVNAIYHKIGSLQREDITVNGQWWRLLAHCFVHGGFIHILLNMVMLYMIGGAVEKMWGSTGYLALYLAAGIGGGCLHLLQQPNNYAVGASGAICGLLGSMPVWILLNRAYLPARLTSEWMRRIMVNIVLIAAFSMLPNVSWEGHLGGGVVGAIVALPLNAARFGRGAQRWLGWAGVAAVPVVAVGIVAASLGTLRAANPDARAELPADNPVVLQAREKYLPVYQEASRVAADALQKYAGRFLAGAVHPKEAPGVVEQAVAGLSRAEKHLLKLAARMTDAGRFGNADITEHVADARKYIVAWAKFLHHFAESLQRPGNWTDQERESLRREWRAADGLRLPLLKSTLFKSVLDEDG